jgi:surfeit locus 1 family protein
MNLLRRLFNKRYRRTTLLVILACGVMIRLGFWQLDRLAQRQAFNAEVRQKLDAPPLSLTGETPDNPETLKFRSATVRGNFDHAQEVALLGQSWQGRPGVHLITPLVIEGSQQAVLVDRGWIPMEASDPEAWSDFATTDPVEITGAIQLSQPRPNAPPWQEPEVRIFRVDIDRLQHQISYPLLPLFVVQAPEPGQTGLPYRSKPDINLGNGPHLSYAIQWFAFTLILVIGYMGFVRQRTQPAQTKHVETLSIPTEA